MFGLIARHAPVEPEQSLYASLEAASKNIPYVDPNTFPKKAAFHAMELSKSQFAFGNDRVIAFRFDAIPDASRCALLFGWKVKGVKAWGLWSRRGPEDVIEQFEEVRTASGLVVGRTDIGALMGSREYVMWFRIKPGSPTNIQLSLNMYTEVEMQTAVLDSPDRYRVVSTEQVDANETTPWDDVMTKQAEVKPIAEIGALPALDENHLLFDTSSDGYQWSPFEFEGRRYVSFTVDLGRGLMDQHLDMLAFGGDYDEWGYDTRAVVNAGTYSWGYRAIVRSELDTNDDRILPTEVLGVRAVVPLKGEKHSGTMVVWFRLRGDKPPRRVLLFYQDPRKKVRDLLGTIPPLS
jgi:hypothetical protein